MQPLASFQYSVENILAVAGKLDNMGLNTLAWRFKVAQDSVLHDKEVFEDFRQGYLDGIRDQTYFEFSQYSDSIDPEYYKDKPNLAKLTSNGTRCPPPSYLDILVMDNCLQLTNDNRQLSSTVRTHLVNEALYASYSVPIKWAEYSHCFGEAPSFKLSHELMERELNSLSLLEETQIRNKASIETLSISQAGNEKQKAMRENLLEHLTEALKSIYTQHPNIPLEELQVSISSTYIRTIRSIEGDLFSVLNLQSVGPNSILSALENAYTPINSDKKRPVSDELNQLVCDSITAYFIDLAVSNSKPN